LRKPEVLQENLKGLGARHVKYGALPEHYPLVGNALLTTFEQYLGSDWTEEVKQAWVDAYGAITKLMLEGADYSSQDLQLEATPTPTPNLNSNKPEPDLNSSAPANAEAILTGKVNWTVLFGIFGFAGLVTIILLLLL
ncbi:MAG: globin domain-containing protein, partial [Xenococcaceae cyanobacterium]